MNSAVKNWLLRSRPFLVFPPMQAFLLLWILPGHDLHWLTLPLVPAAGLFAWSFIEWILHRAAHLSVKNSAVSRFQQQAHMRHHRHPHDVERSVVKLRGSVPLAAFLFALSCVGFAHTGAAVLFHSGLVLGYLSYETVHLASHANWRFPGLNYLTDYHRRHHFGSWGTTFGVTSPLWDWVFGTLPEKRYHNSEQSRSFGLASDGGQGDVRCG